jgi:hypothetical protein
VRPVNFPSAPPPASDTEACLQWIIDALQEIELASQEDPSQIADAMEITNHTPTRSLDPANVTLHELANFVATQNEDTRNRGSTRGAG